MDGIDDLIAAFEAYIGYDVLERVFSDAIFEAVYQAISGVTREEALRIASERAAALVTNISEQTRLVLREKLERALAEQLGPEATARLLREDIVLDRVRAAKLDKLREAGASDEEIARERERLIRDRARVIAQYELGAALEEGNLDAAVAAGATHKVWIVTQGNVCPICEENQAAGPIPIDQPFPSGHVAPLAHPRCLCSMAFVRDTGQGEVERAAERAADRDRRLRESREEAGG